MCVPVHVHRYEGLRESDVVRCVTQLVMDMKHEYGPFSHRPSWMTFNAWVEQGKALARAQHARGLLAGAAADRLQVRVNPWAECR